MSLESLALSVLLPAFPGTTFAPGVLGLLEEGLGGLCLFGSNTAAGREGVAALTAAVRSTSPDAVVAVDEEGGDVTRLHARSASRVLGPLALGAADDVELTRQVGRAIGLELAAVGITLDLGPVADVNSNPDNPVIGTRSFGSSASDVARHVAAWTRGLQSTGVAACAKHFPGHGDTAQDSHTALPLLEADLDTVLARELVPFAAAVDAGVAAVMTSHVVVRALDPRLPATLSPAVLALLRERLGFEGVVVSDALDMAGASAGRGIPEAAVLSVAAGADLLCLGADLEVGLVRSVQAALVDAVRSGRLGEERLAEAAKRVAGLSAAAVEADDLDHARLAYGAARSVTVVGELPHVGGARVVRVDSAGTVAIGAATWGLPADVVVRPGVTDLPAGPLVLQVRDAHRQPAVLATLAAASARSAGSAGSVVVEWGWPAPRPDALPTVFARGWSRPGAEAVAAVLRSAGWTG